MIKSILVPIHGTAADAAMFATAIAVARPLAAHLDFVHVRFSPCVAAVRTRHLEFCVGSEINLALENLRQQDEARSIKVNRQFQDFCDQNAVASAELLQETDHAEERLLLHARQSDLVLMARPHEDDLMPYHLIETLLLRSGRPIMIVPEVSPPTIMDTIMVGWKNSPEASRSIANALPLLKLARRVLMVHITERGGSSSAMLNEQCQDLARHGVSTETRLVQEASKPALQLQNVAAEEGATLLVVGGYSHRPLQEALFGGVTRALIESAELPVFVMH